MKTRLAWIAMVLTILAIVAVLFLRRPPDISIVQGRVPFSWRVASMSPSGEVMYVYFIEGSSVQYRPELMSGVRAPRSPGRSSV